MTLQRNLRDPGVAKLRGGGSMVASNIGQASGNVERFALLYSDGSIGILPADCTVEQAQAEVRFLEEAEHDVSHLAKIVLVRVEVLEMLAGLHHCEAAN